MIFKNIKNDILMVPASSIETFTVLHEHILHFKSLHVAVGVVLRNRCNFSICTDR